MPTVDLTITISVILAIAAIISPVITCLMNNRHQMKLKKLELETINHKENTIYKRDLFEKYLASLSENSYTHSLEARQNYSKYYPLALLYLPQNIREKMIYVDNIIQSCNDKHINVHDHVNELTILISEYIRTM